MTQDQNKPPQSHIIRRHIFWGMTIFLVISFIALQFLALQFFFITGFKLVVWDIFLILFMVALGIVGHYYILWPIEYYKKINAIKEKNVPDWRLNQDASTWLKEEKFGRGCAILCMWLATYWLVATIISHENFGLLLFFAALSIGLGLGQQHRNYPFYFIYIFCLPLVMMFLGTWCHFDSLLPVGAIMVPVNIGSIIIYHYLVDKYQ